MPPAHADADPPSALPRGTRLGEFEIRRVLGVGGFGIVYLAFDHALEREVAIKEYMPGSLAGRSPTTLEVSVLSQANAESFSMGLRSFVNEARLLARFDHPSLVKVHRYWEAHHTAYMAMPYYAGHNLQQTRRAMREPPGEAWLRAIVEPLLGALARLHGEGVYHRDISPDNVLLEPDGRPVLLDFGAARRVIGDKSLALTAILKPAYAPIEQYGEAGAVRQGPWTDLYALGATVHFLLLGRAPPPATTRTVHDEMPPLALQALPGCSERFLRCIDWMLQPRPADRPQQVAELVDALAGRTEPPLPVQDIPRTQTMRHGVPPTAPSPDAEAITARQDKPDAAAWAPTTVARPKTGAAPAVALDATPAAAPSPTPGPALPAAPDIWLDGRDGTVSPVATGALTSDAGDSGTSPADPQAAVPAGPIIERLLPSRPPAAPPQSKNRAPETTRRGAWRLPAALGAGALAIAAAWLGLRGAPAPAPATPSVSAPATATPAPAGLASAAAADMPVPPVAATSPAGQTVAAPAAPPVAASRTVTGNGPPAQRPGAAITAAPATTSARAAAPAPAAGASAAGAYRWPMLPPPPATATPGANTAAPPASQPVHAAPAHATAPAPAPVANAALGTAPAPTPPAAGAAAPTAVASRPTAPAVAAPTPVPRAAPHAEAEPDTEPMVMKARVLSPSERCEGRVLIARWACIERQCSRVPELRNHPECVKLRREAEQRNELR